MREQIPQAIQTVISLFLEHTYSLYLVGGSLRDLLLNRPVKDWDLTTNATPEEMLNLFPDAFYDNQFGTVGIPVELEGEKNVIEVTTFRSEKGYSNRRHPDEVVWGKTIEEDLARRDFTINAMALKLPTNQPITHTSELITTLIDPYHGQEDLKHKIIRAVGDPNLRFKEDALRLMRAIRLATQLSFSIENATLNAIINDSQLLEKISQERIRDELLKVLASDFPSEGIMLLRNTRLLDSIIPELLEGIGVSQERPGRHHKTDVFVHNIMSLKYCPSSDPIVRFATLIHDIGKPRVASADNEGYVIFHNHEIEGAKMASEICDRLRFSNKQREKVTKLVRWHMFTVDEHTTDAAIRRFIRRVGIENIKDVIDLRIGDRLGSGTEKAESWRLKKFKERVEQELQPAAFSINDLAIDGNDIMQELNIKPGPKIGELLQKLFEEVDEDQVKNTKDYLLARIKEL